jgi:hypothetical protein
MINPHLSERFDSIRTDHILRLWDRVRIGFNKCFLENTSVLNWECEEVAIPFDALEKVPLFSLLSEGGLPNDCGFLFLAINEIISMYNVFSERIARFCIPMNDTATRHNKAINPRFIVRGYGDAIKIGAVTPLTEECLTWVAECSWDTTTQMFNMDKVSSLLHSMIDLHDQPPLISNPLDFLRQNFVFRDDAILTWDILGADTGACVDHFGNFFANRQDALLAYEIHQLLDLLNVSSGEGDMRRTMMDHFHCLDYEQIRLLLEGCGNVLSVIHDTQSDLFFDSLASFLDDLGGTSNDQVDLDPFHEMGFPALDDNQMRFVRSLNSSEFVELLLYCIYQMASEAYLFSQLPLNVKEPCTFELKQELKFRLGELCNQTTARVVVDSLEVFIQDVLAYYESPLTKAAAATNEPLQTFLQLNNFCDESDPVFAALPKTVTLRNYVSLRQELHQMKLSFLSASDTNPQANADQKTKTTFNTTSQGRCWLWEDKSLAQEHSAGNGIDAIAPHRSNHNLWKLWFEKEIPGEESVCNSLDTENVHMSALNSETTQSKLKSVATTDLFADESSHDHPDHSAVHFYSAKLIQRWWRNVFACTRRNEFTYDVCIDDDNISENHDDLQSLTKTDEINLELIKECNSDYDDDWPSCDPEITVKPSCDVSNLDLSYGSQSDEMQLRQRLNRYSLPQILADQLLALGARSVDDVCMLLSPEFVTEAPIQLWLATLTFLDRKKLCRFVTEFSQNPQNS